MLNLRKLRESAGLNQRECANQLGLPKTTFCYYEQGRTEPSLEMLVKIANFFNVSLDYLCGRPNENLIFVDGMTEVQKKLVKLIQMLSNEQALIALGYFSDMLKIPYSEVRPARPF